jgi:hypothetical protein
MHLFAFLFQEIKEENYLTLVGVVMTFDIFLKLCNIYDYPFALLLINIVLPECGFFTLWTLDVVWCIHLSLPHIMYNVDCKALLNYK